jgi:soluble lytic murein transglycosylase-like protein
VQGDEVRVTAEPATSGRERRSRELAARRLRMLFLAALTALLLVGGRQPQSVPGPIVEAAFGPSHIEAVLDSWNPSLGEQHVARIARAVERYARQYGLEPELVTAVLLVESSARPWAYSPKGAVGLMQVMPHMMEPLELAGNAATIESNIEAGCFILANNIRRPSEEHGISAYFWGSNIRDLAYLEKVQEARSNIRRSRPS